MAPEGLHHHLLLLAHLHRHGDDLLVALDRRGHAQADSGVAAGRLDHRGRRFQTAVLLQPFDHAHADAILDRAARIQELALAVDLDRQLGTDAVEPDHRRVADHLQDVVVDHGLESSEHVSGGRARRW